MLIKCDFHNNERSLLNEVLPNSYTTETPENLFISLMTDRNEFVIRHIGKFIRTCFNNRKNAHEIDIFTN